MTTILGGAKTVIPVIPAQAGIQVYVADRIRSGELSSVSNSNLPLSNAETCEDGDCLSWIPACVEMKRPRMAIIFK